jgi:hypothetical protein
MRVLIALAALVTIPFAVSVAQDQGRGHDAAHCAARTAKHPSKDINKCPAPTPPAVQPPVDPPVGPPVVVPPPPACAVSAFPVAGSLSLTGRVQDQATGVGLAHWCVELTELSGMGSAIAETDAFGNYVFTGLPDATYLVCQPFDVAVWQQTFPTVLFGGVPCPTGLGWTFPMGGWDASFVNFKYLKL